MNQNLFSHRSPREWLKITVTVPERKTEIIAGFLTGFTGIGIEYCSPVEGEKEDKTSLIGYLEVNQDINEKRGKVEAFLDSLSDSEFISTNYQYIVEEDWGEQWKKNFKAFRASEHIVVKPSWENYTPSPGETIIEIDPGMAFGTGHHASTCLALELIDHYFNKSGEKLLSVLDVGTGTGILGIACCLLGRCKVLAIDNDPDATAIALDNVRANQVTDTMMVKDTPLSDLQGNYDLITANIIHNVLIDLAPQWPHLLAEGGELILSGILKGAQADDILRTCADYGLKPLEMPVKEEWQAFRLKKVRS